MMEGFSILITKTNFGVYFALLILISPYFMRKRFFNGSIKNIVSTAGMFGTFIGIAAGLYLFDVSNISESVPELLGGLKTAFYTSIAGIFSSLIIQIKPGIYRLRSENNKGDEGASVDDKILEELQKINKGIAGEDDSNLLTQIQKMRTDFADKQDELNKAFNEFADKMVKDNTESLVSALEDVMRDFNAKINEQFGDNFKQLNEAVGKILQWQAEYKDSIEISTEALNESREMLTDASKSMEKMVENSKSFGEIAESLKDNLESMDEFSKGIQALAVELEGSGQQIKNEMKEITENSLEELGRNLKGISEALVRDYKEVQKSISIIAGNKS